MADEVTTLDEATAQVIAAEQLPGVEATEPVQPEGDTRTPEQWSKLMAESKSNREKAQAYDRLYSGTSELKALHEASLAYADGDPTAMEALIVQNAASLVGLSVDDYMEKFQEPEDEDDRLMTRKEMKEFLAEQRKEELHSNTMVQRDQIIAKAEKLGYPHMSRLYNDLMWVAQNLTENDLDAAHKIVSETPQQYIQEYIDGQKAKSKAALRPTTGQAPSGAREITSWKDAEQGAEEFLNARI